MQRWRATIVAGGLALGGLLLPGCSDSGSAARITVTETNVEVHESDTVAGATAFEDGFLAITGDGVVFRSDDGRRWSQIRTRGVPGGSGTFFSGIAAGDGFLLAVGMREERASEEGVLRTPLVWRSEDGERWDQLEPSGLTSTFLDFLVAADDGFVVFGSEKVPPPQDYVPTDEEAEELDGGGELPATIDVTSTWRSSDGEAWEKFGENVILPGENSLEGVAAAAIDGGEVLASLGVECNGCYDDYAFVLSKSEDSGGSWKELDPEGLDDLDLANSDVIPVIASTETGFVAVGTSGTEDTEATLWRSDDGHDWTGKRRLGGPKIEAYADGIDAVTATDSGVIALKVRDGRLIVWQVTL
jgi:hypothetical protein